MSEKVSQLVFKIKVLHTGGLKSISLKNDGVVSSFSSQFVLQVVFYTSVSTISIIPVFQPPHI